MWAGLLRYQFSAMTMLLHPSVLISISPTPPLSTDFSREQLSSPSSASGFIIAVDGNGDILVVTTASWLSDVLEIQSLEAEQVSWKFYGDMSIQEPQFVVLVQRAFDSSTKTCQMSASIANVCLMKDVLVSLREELHSLSHWRTAIGEKGDSPTTLTESLLIPLSCLVLLKLTTSTDARLTDRLCFTFSPPALGQSVVAIGTPFGAFCPEVFYNCQSPGTVCKVLGSRNGVLVTDASLPCGSEGAIIVAEATTVCDTNQVINVLGMVIAGLLSGNGHSSGLSLACSAHSMWQALHSSSGLSRKLLQQLTHPIAQDLTVDEEPPQSLREAVVLVMSGGEWASGMLLSDTVVLTCHHVVNNDKDITVHTESGESFKAQVIFTNPIPDCALLKLSMPVHHSHPLITASKSPDAKSPPDKVYSSCFKEHPQAIEGRSVTIIGYGCQDPYTLGYHSPLLTRGCVIKAVCSDGGRVVMLVTTAVLLPGMSGGLVVDTVTGEPLGMAVSNSKDLDSGVCYSKLNYCLPLSWIMPPLVRYLVTNDDKCLHILTTQGKECSNFWNLTSSVYNNRMATCSKL